MILADPDEQPPSEPLSLSDGRIRIRRFRPSDADDLYEAASESAIEIYRWLSWCSPEYMRQDSVEWIAQTRFLWNKGLEYHFAVIDEETGRFLGGCGLNYIDLIHRSADLGYWIRTSATRRGAAGAATHLAARFAFETLGFVRVALVIAAENFASIRSAEKAGATREGVIRNGIILHGRMVDAVQYSLVPQDLGLPEPFRVSEPVCMHEPVPSDFPPPGPLPAA